GPMRQPPRPCATAPYCHGPASPRGRRPTPGRSDPPASGCRKPTRRAPRPARSPLRVAGRDTGRHTRPGPVFRGDHGAATAGLPRTSDSPARRSDPRLPVTIPVSEWLRSRACPPAVPAPTEAGRSAAPGAHRGLLRALTRRGDPPSGEHRPKRKTRPWTTPVAWIPLGWQEKRHAGWHAWPTAPCPEDGRATASPPTTRPMNLRSRVARPRPAQIETTEIREVDERRLAGDPPRQT